MTADLKTFNFRKDYPCNETPDDIDGEGSYRK